MSTIDNYLNSSIYVDENVEYVMNKDIGMALGSVYVAISKWFRNDIKAQMNFFTKERNVYINNAISTVKKFPPMESFLVSKIKPSISFDYGINFDTDYDPLNINPADNFEAVKYLRASDFTEHIMGFEDELIPADAKAIKEHDLAVSVAYRTLNISVVARIYTNSKYDMTNMANFLETKRKTGSKYELKMLVNYELPRSLIYYLANRYGYLDKDSNIKREEFLAFLNRSSVQTVYYTINRATNKVAYVVSSVQKVIVDMGEISPEISRPIGEVLEYASVARTFDINVRVPMYFAVTRYGTRYLFKDTEEDISLMGVDDPTSTTAEVRTGFLLREYQRVFEEKHAYKESPFQYTKEDLLSYSPSEREKKIAKIDLLEFLKNDNYLTGLCNWALSKGFKYKDIFYFKLYGTSIERFEKVEPTEDQSIYRNEEDYIVNTEEMYIVDFHPVVGNKMSLVTHINLNLFNEYNRINADFQDNVLAQFDDGDQSKIKLYPNKSDIDYLEDY